MSTHTITAAVPVKFGFSGFDGHEVAFPTLEMTYEYRKGSPAVGPSFSHGGLPADPPEVELLSVKLIDGDGLAPADSPMGEKYLIEDWADGFANSDDGYNLLCDFAEREILNEASPDFDEDYYREHDLYDIE